MRDLIASPHNGHGAGAATNTRCGGFGGGHGCCDLLWLSSTDGDGEGLCGVVCSQHGTGYGGNYFNGGGSGAPVDGRRTESPLCLL